MGFSHPLPDFTEYCGAERSSTTSAATMVAATTTTDGLANSPRKASVVAARLSDGDPDVIAANLQGLFASANQFNTYQKLLCCFLLGKLCKSEFDQAIRGFFAAQSDKARATELHNKFILAICNRLSEQAQEEQTQHEMETAAAAPPLPPSIRSLSLSTNCWPFTQADDRALQEARAKAPNLTDRCAPLVDESPSFAEFRKYPHLCRNTRVLPDPAYLRARLAHVCAGYGLDVEVGEECTQILFYAIEDYLKNLIESVVAKRACSHLKRPRISALVATGKAPSDLPPYASSSSAQQSFASPPLSDAAEAALVKLNIDDLLFTWRMTPHLLPEDSREQILRASLNATAPARPATAPFDPASTLHSSK